MAHRRSGRRRRATSRQIPEAMMKCTILAHPKWYGALTGRHPRIVHGGSPLSNHIFSPRRSQYRPSWSMDSDKDLT